MKRLSIQDYNQWPEGCNPSHALDVLYNQVFHARESVYDLMCADKDTWVHMDLWNRIHDAVEAHWNNWAAIPMPDYNDDQ